MKFKKGMSVAYVLYPIIMLSIALPVFFLSYTTKHTNNIKKILQEAAYTGALAGALAVDIDSFEKGFETNPTLIGGYPYDKTTDNPVTFMKQKNFARLSGNIISEQDILLKKGISRETAKGLKLTSYSNEDVAASEAIEAAKSYLQKSLSSIKDKHGNLVYVDNTGKLKDDVFNISVYCERDNLEYRIYKNDGKTIDSVIADGKESAYPGPGPYNQITVTVSLNYKPIMYASIFNKDKIVSDEDFRIPIYGTSSARTKTIL